MTILDPRATDAPVLRPAEPGDARVVRYIDSQVFPLGSADLEPAPAGELEQAIEDKDVFLLELQQQAVGYLHIDRRRPDRVYLSGFGLLPEHQGHGLGTIMAREIEPILTEYQDKHPIYTVTSPHNTRMLRILFGWGFAGRWALPDHFGPGRHRIGCQLLHRTNELWRSTQICTVPVGDYAQLRDRVDAGWVLRSLITTDSGARFQLAAGGATDFLPCPAPEPPGGTERASANHP